jgi:hypothetical protein
MFELMGKVSALNSKQVFQDPDQGEYIKYILEIKRVTRERNLSKKGGYNITTIF